MDEKNLNELKELKHLLEAGAISKTEFDKMKDELLRESMANDGVKSARKKSGFAKFIKNNKLKLAGLVVLIIGMYFTFILMKADPEVEAKKLAEMHCDCQIKNNEESITRLMTVGANFDQNKYRFAEDADKEISKIESQFANFTLSPDVSACYKKFDIMRKEAEEKWKKDTDEGKKFWRLFHTHVAENSKIIEQSEQINALKTNMEEKKGAMSFSNSNEFRSHKQSIISLINSLYSNMNYSSFDAYNYFAYNVENYLASKNVTPTDINLQVKKSGDYSSKETKLIEETLELKSTTKDYELWVFSTEFRAFRNSMEKYQICNVWFEIKVNSSNKIVSYKEIKTENKRYLEPSEYNEMFNSGYDNSGDQGW